MGRSGDTDYAVARSVARHDEEPANAIGDLVNRPVSMVAKYRDGTAGDRQ